MKILGWAGALAATFGGLWAANRFLLPLHMKLRKGDIVTLPLSALRPVNPSSIAGQSAIAAIQLQAQNNPNSLVTLIDTEIVGSDVIGRLSSDVFGLLSSPGIGQEKFRAAKAAVRIATRNGRAV